MKNFKIYSIFLLLLISIATLAQGQKNAEQYKMFKSTYERALKYNDYAAAKNALYNMLSADPANDSALYTLAYFYYDTKQYASTILVCLDVVKKNPNNLNVIEAMAVSYENLGLKQKALENYEKMYLLDNNFNALYKTTFLQFDLKRYDECITNIDILLSQKQVDSVKLIYSFEQDKQQEFPMRVSVLTLKGMVSKEQGDKEGAKKSFEDALAISPNFKLAKDNLESVK